MNITNHIFNIQYHISKSFVSNQLYDFVDTDKLIEEKSGKKINKIFEIYGEDYFRKYEEKIILDVLKLKNVEDKV